MFYLTVLSLHLVGAFFTAGIAAYALVALYRGFAHVYRKAALVLALATALEILTGALLAVISSSISAQIVCERVALYIALIFAIEYLLYTRMKNLSILFPMARVVSPIAGTLAVLLGALALGF